MMRAENRLLAMLREKIVPIGMHCHSGHPDLIEIMGLSGLDFVMLDTEHTGLDPRGLEDLIRVADAASIVPLVRIPDCGDMGGLRRALEAGAQGIFLPRVTSAHDVRRALAEAHFPPRGRRGMCPAVRGAGFSLAGWDDFVAWNEANILVIPIIEHPDAVAAIDEICAVEGLHMLTFGAGDFACALGGGPDVRPAVAAAYGKVREAAKAHRLAFMNGPLLGATPEACAQALADGADILFVGLDLMIFRRSCEAAVGAANAAVAGHGLKRPPAPPSGFPG